MGFPPAGAEICCNEAGEPLGWDRPQDEDAWYCDECGFAHGGACPEPEDYDEDEDPPEYDPGDEAGEFRAWLPDGGDPPF
jgi:hypothetical protein